MKAFLNVLKNIFWICILLTILIVFTDYMMVKSDKEPIFCIKKDTLVKDDYTIYRCTGIVYKYYSITSDSYYSKKFVPIWSKDTE